MSARAVWGPRASGELLPLLAILIVLRALVSVAQDLMGFTDLLELVFGGFVAGVDIRVVLTRELAIGGFDLLLIRRSRDSQYLVIVFVARSIHVITRPPSPVSRPRSPVLGPCPRSSVLFVLVRLE